MYLLRMHQWLTVKLWTELKKQIYHIFEGRLKMVSGLWIIEWRADSICGMMFCHILSKKGNVVSFNTMTSQELNTKDISQYTNIYLYNVPVYTMGWKTMESVSQSVRNFIIYNHYWEKIWISHIALLKFIPQNLRS